MSKWPRLGTRAARARRRPTWVAHPSHCPFQNEQRLQTALSRAAFAAVGTLCHSEANARHYGARASAAAVTLPYPLPTHTSAFSTAGFALAPLPQAAPRKKKATDQLQDGKPAKRARPSGKAATDAPAAAVGDIPSSAPADTPVEPSAGVKRLLAEAQATDAPAGLLSPPVPQAPAPASLQHQQPAKMRCKALQRPPRDADAYALYSPAAAAPPESPSLALLADAAVGQLRAHPPASAAAPRTVARAAPDGGRKLSLATPGTPRYLGNDATEGTRFPAAFLFSSSMQCAVRCCQPCASQPAILSYYSSQNQASPTNQPDSPATCCCTPAGEDDSPLPAGTARGALASFAVSPSPLPGGKQGRRSFGTSTLGPADAGRQLRIDSAIGRAAKQSHLVRAGFHVARSCWSRRCKAPRESALLHCVLLTWQRT